MHTIAQIMCQVLASLAESELDALFLNAKEVVPNRYTLKEMGHNQPPPPIQTNNSTAFGVVSNGIQPRRLKSMDMIFHWLRDREAQKYLRFYWWKGALNLEDCWTKHHCPARHLQMRPLFLSPQGVVTVLRLALKRVARNSVTKRVR